MKEFEYYAMLYWAECNLKELNELYNLNFKLPKSKSELYDLAYHKQYWLEEKIEHEFYIPFKEYLRFAEN